MDGAVQQNDFFGNAFGAPSDDDDSFLDNNFAQPAFSPQAPFFHAVPPTVSSFIRPSGPSIIDPQPTVQPRALFNDTNGERTASNENLLLGWSSSSGQLPPHMGSGRERYGQYTPDSDNTPKADHHQGLRRSTSVSQKSPDQVERVKNKTKGKGSSSAKTGGDDPRRRPTKESVESGPEEDQKRESFKYRNRMAAHKCRQKKKRYVDELSEKWQDVSATNRLLQAEQAALNAEIFDLKNKMFQHANCGFRPIDLFIEAQATKVCSRAVVGSQPRPPPNVTTSESPALELTEVPGLGHNARFETPSNRNGSSTGSPASMIVEAQPYREDWVNMTRPG